MRIMTDHPDTKRIQSFIQYYSEYQANKLANVTFTEKATKLLTRFTASVSVGLRKRKLSLASIYDGDPRVFSRSPRMRCHVRFAT
jgi:hypothetical protein